MEEPQKDPGGYNGVKWLQRPLPDGHLLFFNENEMWEFSSLHADHLLGNSINYSPESKDLDATVPLN